MLAVAVALAAGIVLAQPQKATLAATLVWVPWLLAATAAAMLAGLLLLRAQRRSLAAALALLGFVLAGAAAARLFEFRFPPHHVSHLESQGMDLANPLRLAGRLDSSPVRTPTRVQFDLEVESVDEGGHAEPWSGKVRLSVRGLDRQHAAAYLESLHLHSGDAVRVEARLHRPFAYRNPGAFDYRRWMEQIQDVYWVGSVRSPKEIEKLPGGGAWALTSLPDRLRQRLLRGIDAIYPPWTVEGRDGAVLKAILLGDRSALDSKTIEGFRQSGLYHLLVISGLHVGLLALLLALLLRLLPVGEIARSALIVAFLFGYLSLVELRAPTLRATLMISLYLVARFFYRHHSALNAVGLAALLLLLYRPAWLFEAGFQLSFTAALLIVGLIVPILERTTEPYRRALRTLGEVELDETFAPRRAQFRLELRMLADWVGSHVILLRHRPRAARVAVTWPLRGATWAANMVLFTAILQIGLLLPMAETFHLITFAGIGLNALAIPLMTVLLALAVPTVALAALAPGLAAWPAKLLALVMRGLFALTSLPHLPHWLSYRVPAPPAWVAWGFAASVVAAALAWGRRRWVFRASVAALAVFAALVSLDPFPPQLPRGELQVTALDCGEGDAIFVVLPDQTTLLVDAGGEAGYRPGEPYQGRWDPGESIVSPYLWSRGVKRIDFLVSSSTGGGHLQGLGAIARNFRVGEFWQIPHAGSQAYARLLEVLDARHVPIRRVAAGDVLREGRATIRFLWPPGAPRAANGEIRNDVLSLRISQGAASALLTGRLSRGLESDLVSRAGFQPTPMLAVAGRGRSRFLSPQFLGRLEPRVMLVSGGAERYGEKPERDLEPAAGMEVFQTERQGAVTAEMAAKSSRVRFYRASAEGIIVESAPADSASASSLKLP